MGLAAGSRECVSRVSYFCCFLASVLMQVDSASTGATQDMEAMDGDTYDGNSSVIWFARRQFQMVCFNFSESISSVFPVQIVLPCVSAGVRLRVDNHLFSCLSCFVCKSRVLLVMLPCSAPASAYVWTFICFGLHHSILVSS